MTSAFDAPTKEQDQVQTTGQDDNQNTTDDWLEKVVAEKGEHWKDPKTLAKGYAHAQQRIKELEALEEKFKEQNYAKSLLEQLQNKQAPETPSGSEVDKQNEGGAENAGETSLTSEDIERLLESKLSARTKSERVEKALRDKFGDQANRVVHRKAEELNLSIDKMKALAMDSPDAFLRLIGEPEQKQTNSTRESSVNTSGYNSSGGERNAAHYAKLRRENRKLYNSPVTQTQMIEDRKRLGDKFYT